MVLVAHRGCVQLPFAFTAHDAAVTTTSPLRLPHLYPAPVAADRLWEALVHARTGALRQQVADLEDAVFRMYLPPARTLSDSVKGDTGAERLAAEQAAELGLAQAVLDWPHPSSAGFRRYARATILRQLLNR